MDRPETEIPNQDIMEATHRALLKYGYTDLTVEKIASEYDKGKSTIYYHFDNKEELMVEYFDYLLEIIGSEISESTGNPSERLEFFLDKALAVDDQEMRNFRIALLELRSQAPYKESYSTKFRELDAAIIDTLTDIFRQANCDKPEVKAEIAISIIEGFMDRSISMSQEKNTEESKKAIMKILDD